MKELNDVDIPLIKREKTLFNKGDYELILRCPWCKSARAGKWGEELDGFTTVKCRDCGLIYVRNRLNYDGLNKYYKNYYNKMHQLDRSLNEKRDDMYWIEYDYVARFMKKRSTVLDVGCGGGLFLDEFKKNGHRCYGVEFGEAAARAASKRHKVWQGDFPYLDIPYNFDIISFRGVIEHVPDTKAYLKKAVSQLNKDGLIYITSTPNADAFCCDLFKEKWRMHVPEQHLMHFRPVHFDDYFGANGFVKVSEYYFYEETPYADIEQDILKVAAAIELKNKGKRINFKSPAFWGTMMTLVYKKG